MNGSRWIAYDFAVLRAVPHPHLGRWVPIGVVLHARTADFLGMLALQGDALRRRVPDVDPGRLERYLRALRDVCEGSDAAGPLGLDPPSERFHWMTAPRSDVLQPSEVHGGMTRDPVATLARLFRCHVQGEDDEGGGAYSPR